MSSILKDALAVFAKSKKGNNVKFKSDRLYTDKAKSKGLGDCQDLIDLGLKTIGGRMGDSVIAPDRGLLVTFDKHKTNFQITISATRKNVKEGEPLFEVDFTMNRPNHIAIIDKVVIKDKQFWIWEQNASPDKKTVLQPVRSDKRHVIKKKFQASGPLVGIKNMVKKEMSSNSTKRFESLADTIDWESIEKWWVSTRQVPEQCYGLLVEIKIISTGTIKFHNVVEDNRP